MSNKGLTGPCEVSVGFEEHAATTSTVVQTCGQPGKHYDLIINLPGGVMMCDEHAATSAMIKKESV